MFYHFSFFDNILFVSIMWQLGIRRYDVSSDSYHSDMEGNGLLCSAVDILPTEFAKEVQNSFP